MLIIKHLYFKVGLYKNNQKNLIKNLPITYYVNTMSRQKGANVKRFDILIDKVKLLL